MTADAMVNIDDNLEMKQLMSTRAAIGHRFGLLPYMPFKAEGFFVKGRFEIPHLKCTAILPSGMIVSVDEPVSIAVPKMDEGVYYLCVGYGPAEVTFEKDGMEFSRPAYEYSIMTEEEINADDVMPVSRFKVQNNECSLEAEYIPPCMMISCDERFLNIRDRLADSLKKIVYHPNLTDGNGKYNLERYLFHLRGISVRQTSDKFMIIATELANAVNYFIISGHDAESKPISPASPYDVEKWLSWLCGYLDEAISVLDNTTPKNDGPDINALMDDLEKRLYERLSNELRGKLEESLRASLIGEIETRIGDLLKDYVDGTVKENIIEAVTEAVSDRLHTSLHDTLYPELYDALYRPPVAEEDNFMPLI